jgi:hypothetical protein
MICDRNRGAAQFEPQQPLEQFIPATTMDDEKYQWGP